MSENEEVVETVPDLSKRTLAGVVTYMRTSDMRIRRQGLDELNRRFRTRTALHVPDPLKTIHETFINLLFCALEDDQSEFHGLTTELYSCMYTTIYTFHAQPASSPESEQRGTNNMLTYLFVHNLLCEAAMYIAPHRWCRVSTTSLKERSVSTWWWYRRLVTHVFGYLNRHFIVREALPSLEDMADYVYGKRATFMWTRLARSVAYVELIANCKLAWAYTRLLPGGSGAREAADDFYKRARSASSGEEGLRECKCLCV